MRFSLRRDACQEELNEIASTSKKCLTDFFVCSSPLIKRSNRKLAVEFERHGDPDVGEAGVDGGFGHCRGEEGRRA